MSNKYREITDEFYELFKSFMESGFTDEQAIELTKSYCVNNVFENIYRNASAERRTLTKAELRRNMMLMKQRQQENAGNTAVGNCQICGQWTPFLIGINKQIAGEFKQINVCPECRDKHERELARTRENFQRQFGD